MPGWSPGADRGKGVGKKENNNMAGPGISGIMRGIMRATTVLLSKPVQQISNRQRNRRLAREVYGRYSHADAASVMGSREERRRERAGTVGLPPCAAQ